jgi:hypothetical protein
MANQGDGIDLFTLFQGVMGQLQNNKDQLNKADEYNHDHGDNMVDTFTTITQAIKEKQGANPADQLAYASQILKQKQSGSSQLYANGLSQAAQQFQGQKQVTPNNAMTLIQSLLGGGQEPVKQQQQQTGGLGGILGSIFSGGKAAWDKPGDSGKASADKPASSGKAAWDKPAFGGKAAWEKPAFGGKAAWDKQPEPAPTAKDDSKIPAGQDYISAMLAELPAGWKATLDPESGDYRIDNPYGFETVAPKNLRKYITWARQNAGLPANAQPAPAGQPANLADNTPRVDSTLESIVNAVVSNSASNSGYRQQSGSIVTSTLMQAIQGLLKK